MIKNNNQYLKRFEIVTSNLRLSSMALETVISKVGKDTNLSKDLTAITSMVEVAISVADDLVRELSNKNIDEDNAILH